MKSVSACGQVFSEDDVERSVAEHDGPAGDAGDCDVKMAEQHQKAERLEEALNVAYLLCGGGAAGGEIVPDDAPANWIDGCRLLREREKAGVYLITSARMPWKIMVEDLEDKLSETPDITDREVMIVAGTMRPQVC
jgi:hypothetical protein